MPVLRSSPRSCLSRDAPGGHQWNIGTVVTGLYNPTSKEFALSWDRVLGENCQQGQASFFLNGVVHFDADVQPVPIPAAAWLFGSGLAGIAALARRYSLG